MFMFLKVSEKIIEFLNLQYIVDLIIFLPCRMLRVVLQFYFKEYNNSILILFFIFFRFLIYFMKAEK